MVLFSTNNVLSGVAKLDARKIIELARDMKVNQAKGELMFLLYMGGSVFSAVCLLAQLMIGGGMP
jgi:hypothetical protein